MSEPAQLNRRQRRHVERRARRAAQAQHPLAQAMRSAFRGITTRRDAHILSAIDARSGGAR